MANPPSSRFISQKMALLVATGALALSAAGCVTETGPAGGTTTAAAPAAQPPQTTQPIRFGGPCRQINIGTPDNPRFIKDPACGSGASN